MFAEPAYTCGLCPRLKAFRDANNEAHPDWYNGPVPAFGGLDARLLIVGLAPGIKGANLTGRPFTGDYAGDLLYATLREHDFACVSRIVAVCRMLLTEYNGTPRHRAGCDWRARHMQCLFARLPRSHGGTPGELRILVQQLGAPANR